ncbi:RHS repeat-associated core domain-containing protein, partial [Streptomyces sp. NPDC059371]|uniref:RHS repeat-associated core domain-containing protein n=1 Tax=Streptomyces sp. NPDC059371 TaxID=3346812 RepID=UPI0036A1E1EC
RLYNPTTGRFLSTDPVHGGNANPYEYVTADPVNQYDLDGRSRFSWIKRGWRAIPRAYRATRTFFHYTPTRFMFFAKKCRYFCMRDGRPALHWGNHQNRIEWDGHWGWHYNKAGDKGHYSVRRGLWNLGKSGFRRAWRWGTRR